MGVDGRPSQRVHLSESPNDTRASRVLIDWLINCIKTYFIVWNESVTQWSGHSTTAHILLDLRSLVWGIGKSCTIFKAWIQSRKMSDKTCSVGILFDGCMSLFQRSLFWKAFSRKFQSFCDIYTGIWYTLRCIILVFNNFGLWMIVTFDVPIKKWCFSVNI